MAMRLPPSRNPDAAGASAPDLLARARELQSAGRLEEAETLADRALELQERAVGREHPSLVPFLLVGAGILFQRSGWAAGRPLYDRAQALRAAQPPRRWSGSVRRPASQS
jgi:hypothetical protein